MLRSIGILVAWDGRLSKFNELWRKANPQCCTSGHVDDLENRELQHVGREGGPHGSSRDKFPPVWSIWLLCLATLSLRPSFMRLPSRVGPWGLRMHLVTHEKNLTRWVICYIHACMRTYQHTCIHTCMAYIHHITLHHYIIHGMTLHCIQTDMTRHDIHTV